MDRHHGTQGGPGEPDHYGHGGRDGHEDGHGRATAGGAASWAEASRATLHCLTGCALGEVLGLVIGTALAWHNLPTMVTAIALAFLFGYSLTLYAVLRAHVGLKTAVRVALTADTVSIAVMEAVDNAVVALVPGALDAHLSDLLFWVSLGASFAVAFAVTTPVNRWMIGRGRGHAVMHSYH